MHFTDPGLAARLTLFISLVLLAAWLLYFDQSAVRRIGFAYAESLFDWLAVVIFAAERTFLVERSGHARQHI